MEQHWQGVVRQKTFWTDYYWVTEEDRAYPELADQPIELRVTSDLVLLLDIDEELASVDLELSGSALPEALELGWDDQAHFHPYVFRWEELELICRYLGKRPEFIVNPVVPLLLLYRFAPVTAADDETRIRQLLKAAWSSLGLFTDSEIETIIGKTVPKRGDLHWAPHAELGWVLEGEAAYSLRRAEHDRFPFAQLQELMRGAGDGFE